MAIAGLLLPAVFASCPCQQLLPAASAGCPCQQLRHGAQASTSFPMELRCNYLASNSSAIAPRPAASSRWLFAAAPLPVAAMPRRSLQQHLCYGAPASNKPHPAEKSTPVWLAIWRTWAGFANSQLRCATFINLYLYICAYPRYCHLGAAAQTDANLSAHLHRLPTPPPYLRQMGCRLAGAQVLSAG